MSKLLAAGLSAGMFLVWWPAHHPMTGIGALVVRGALWTLVYEMLVLAFAPLERATTRALRPHLDRARQLAERLWRVDVPAPARLGGACVLACAGAVLPMTLLAGAHPLPAASTHPVKRVIIVKRPVVRERVVVRQVVTVPADISRPGDTPQPTTTYVPTPQVHARKTATTTKAAKRTATRSTPRRAAAIKTTAPVATIPEATTTPAASPAPTAPATTPSAPAATQLHSAS